MQSVHPTANTLVSHLSLDAREVSFSSRESIEREVPQPLVEACEDLYGKNVRVHRVGLATDGDLTASLWVDADHLSLHNRLTALGYGDETVIPDRPAIRMDFRYSERTTSQELSSLTLAATRRFEPQEATWIESWSPEEIRRRALFSDKTTEEYAMELGYYRDHRGGRYYRSYELWIKAYPDAGAQDANLRKIPGYALLSPEARRLLARQYSIYSRLCDLSPETVTATRHKIGLRLLTPETLVHGTRYDHEKISSIASRGILSSEFRGGNEKRMCRYCSEFFRVPRIMSVREYVEYYHTPEAFFTTMQGLVPFYVDRLESELFPKRSSDEAFVAFFIDTEHGDLSELLDREAYRWTDAEMRELSKSLPYDPQSPEAGRMSAILCGIPSRYIAWVLVSNAILRSPEDIGHIRGSFGPDVFIFSLDGEIVPERRVSVMEDDTPNWLRS